MYAVNRRNDIFQYENGSIASSSSQNSISPHQQKQNVSPSMSSLPMRGIKKDNRRPTITINTLSPSNSEPLNLNSKRSSPLLSTPNITRFPIERSYSASTEPMALSEPHFEQPRKPPPIPKSKSSINLRGVYNNNSPRRQKEVPAIPNLPLKQKSIPIIPPIDDEESEIRKFVHSTKLTQLMILQRFPYIGKTVSFADVGDSQGHPVFVFLGLGAVRYLIGLYDEMAAALHLRLICIDRWGIGKSDDLPSEQRGILEWSKVVIEVADRLKIKKFSLLAHSAGAPYAMATCLTNSNRIAGPVHLLAPWVSPGIENGYKWLKYIPDGVIRTAQAAEWKMQSWRLGSVKSTTPTPDTSINGGEDSMNLLPFPNSPTISSTSTAARSYDSVVSSKNVEFISRSTSSSSSSSLMANQANLNKKALPNVPKMEDSLKSNNRIMTNQTSIGSLSEHIDILNAAWQGNLLNDESEISMKANNNNNNNNNASSILSTKLETLDVPKINTSINEISTLTNSKSSIKNNTSTIDLATELLRASHSESFGSTNDLFVILGRNSQKKPWGFSYKNIKEKILIWYGDKDEKINFSSIFWMKSELLNCQIEIIKNANHNLMTNFNVIIDVLESLAGTKKGDDEDEEEEDEKLFNYSTKINLKTSI